MKLNPNDNKIFVERGYLKKINNYQEKTYRESISLVDKFEDQSLILLIRLNVTYLRSQYSYYLTF